MTENVENLILEHLGHIRGQVDQIAEDPGTVKSRLSSLKSQVAGLHGDNAIAHQRMDAIERRLERVEKRLDLHEPA
jgi:demethoxyubiquinone hydroxylase (CLK1/Coq7/Cat5 family)